MKKTMKKRAGYFENVKTVFGKTLGILFFTIFAFGLSFSSKACSPLAVPPLVNQSISNGNLVLNWQSINTWVCPGYSVEVEVACIDQQFSGVAPFFRSPTLNKTTDPEAFPTQTISLAQFCPGKVYQFRAREIDSFAQSAWSAAYTFTVPGVYVPPTLNLSASNNIVCPPQTSQLNAGVNNLCGGPITYVWTPTLGLSNPNIVNPIATPTVSTVYSVTVNGGKYGCWTLNGSIPINTGQDPPAVGTASAIPSIVCVGKTTTLQLSSFTGNVQWQSSSSGAGPWNDLQGGVTGTFVTQPLTTTTCFRAIVSTCTGTLFSNIVCVNVNVVPVLAPSVIQANCTNTLASVNLNNPGSSGNPITATWTPGPISLGAQSTTATYLQPGVVTVTLTFSDGCVSSTQFTINTPPPVPQFTIVNVTGSQSITCLNPTVTLNAANNYTYGSLTYNWSSASFTSTNQQIDISNPATYSCYVLDPATNCGAQHTVSIFLNQVIPTSNVNPVNQNILCGPGVVATATGTAISPTLNVTHCWFAPGIDVPVCGGGQYSIFGLGAPGTYTYVLTDNVNGCTTTKTLQVTSNLGYPTYNVTSLANFTLGCSTKSVTDAHIVDPNTTPLSGGSMSFAVLPPGFSQPTYTYSSILDYTFTVPGNYTFIVQDINNLCETRITVPIIQDVFQPNILANVPTRTLTCRTPTTLLEGISTTTPVAYSWSFQNGGNPNTIPNATTMVQTTTNTAISATVVNVYTLTITNTNNLCKSSTVIPVYQNIRPPKPKINGTGPLDCINLEQTLVNGSSLDEAPGYFAPLGTAVTKWEGPSPQVDNTDTIASYKAKTVGIYTMTVMDRNNGCITSTTVLVPDNKIYPVITADPLYFLDCGNPSYRIEPSYTPSTGLTYRWNTEPGVSVSNTSLSTLAVSEPGSYQIFVRNTSNGCTAAKMIVVGSGTLSGDFEADVYTGYAPLTVNFTNKSVSTSTTTGSSSVTAVWSFGNGTTKTTTTNIGTSVLYTQPGNYTVTLFTSKGACQDTVVKVITVDIPSKLEVPNVFTPNGDNSNDIFFVKTANLSEITAMIYDRWGNKVYELTTGKGNIAWDGKNLTGKDSPDGTYFYIITAKGKDGQNYDAKGNVSLYR